MILSVQLILFSRRRVMFLSHQILSIYQHKQVQNKILKAMY